MDTGQNNSVSQKKTCCSENPLQTRQPSNLFHHLPAPLAIRCWAMKSPDPGLFPFRKEELTEAPLILLFQKSPTNPTVKGGSFMSDSVLDAFSGAEDSVRQLVEVCRKAGHLYARSPKKVAQVNRTAKWLLNALSALRRDLTKEPTSE
jgi:hypothetical protein